MKQYIKLRNYQEVLLFLEQNKDLSNYKDSINNLSEINDDYLSFQHYIKECLSKYKCILLKIENNYLLFNYYYLETNYKNLSFYYSQNICLNLVNDILNMLEKYDK